MIIPTHSTKNSFKHKTFKLIVSVEVVGIIFIINIIYRLQNNKETMAFTYCLWGHCWFKATEFCTAVWGPTVLGHQIQLFVFYTKTKAKWPQSTLWSYIEGSRSILPFIFTSRPVCLTSGKEHRYSLNQHGNFENDKLPRFSGFLSKICCK